MRNIKRRMLIFIILIALLAFGAGIGTYAYFTSSVTSEGNVFTAGTLIIGGGNADGSINSSLQFSNIAPGIEFGVAKTIIVKNTGSLPFKYRVSASRTSGDDAVGSFYNTLIVKVDTKVGDSYQKLYEKNLKDLNGDIINSDLAADATEEIQFTVYLPDNAGNEYQGKTATANFVFEATQTNNNGWTQSGS